MAKRVVSVALILCVLIVGGLASAKTVSHETHHAHHQAATHGNPLCSWMCAAGQMSDAGLWVLPQHCYAVADAPTSMALPVAGTPARTHASRAPPSIL